MLQLVSSRPAAPVIDLRTGREIDPRQKAFDLALHDDALRVSARLSAAAAEERLGALYACAQDIARLCLALEGPRPLTVDEIRGMLSGAGEILIAQLRAAGFDDQAPVSAGGRL